MTAKEKAKELVDKFEYLVLYDFTIDDKPFFDYQKECALIAVNLRLEGDFIFSSIEYGGEDSLEYWIQVKKEIENL